MGLIKRLTAASLNKVAADKLAQLQQVDEHSTNLLSGYRNDTLAGPRIFPIVEVRKESGVFTEYGPSPFMQRAQLQRAMTSSRITADFTTATGTYFSNYIDVAVPIYDRELDNIADSDLDSFVEKKSQLGEDIVQLAMEYEVAAIISDVSQYASGYTVTLAGNAQWKNGSTSTPVNDIRVGVRKVALRNGVSYDKIGIAFGVKALEALEDHPQIQAKIQYGGSPAQPSVVDLSALQKVFKVGECIALQAQYPIQVDPQDPTVTLFDFMWGDIVAIYVITKKPTLASPLAGAIVRKSGYPYVSEYRDEGKDATVKVVRDHYGVTLRKSSGGINRMYLINAASGLT